MPARSRGRTVRSGTCPSTSRRPTIRVNRPSNAMPDFRRPGRSADCRLIDMTDLPTGIIDRYNTASAEFAWRVRSIGPDQWTLPTPCPEWNVRQLVNHMARGNLMYIDLLAGGTGAVFLRMRDVDALGDDPVGAYAASVRECAEVFGRPGALQRELDYPLGRVFGHQALTVITTDTAVHAWDLARALGVDERLEPDLVAWIDDNLEVIYAGLPETPPAVETTHRFFAAPSGRLTDDASRQDRLLDRMGRRPGTGLPIFHSGSSRSADEMHEDIDQQIEHRSAGR